PDLYRHGQRLIPSTLSSGGAVSHIPHILRQVMNRRGFLALGSMAAVTGLAGCAVQKDLSSDEMIRNAVYHHGGQPRLTLFTMISNDTGSGAHTSLMINASQRVIFDPAGSFRNETIPVRGDVVYGVT